MIAVTLFAGRRLGAGANSDYRDDTANGRFDAMNDRLLRFGPSVD
jgi:hypothetical protein